MALVRPVLMKRRWPFSWAFVRARLVLSGTLNGCGVSSVPSMSKNKIFLLFIRSPLKWDFFFVVTVINAMSGDGFCDYIFGRIQCADTDAVEFYFAFHGDHQAFAAVDDPGFYQVCAVRCYVDYHIRSFDLDFSGVGVSLTYLSETEQIWVKDCIVSGASSVTGSMATKLKQYSDEGNLTELAVQLILNEKKTETGKVTLTEKKIRKYFPKEYNREQIEQVIYELLDNWKKSQ